MTILFMADEDSCILSPENPIILAIGSFDGVHLGHQRVIKEAINKAQLMNGKAAVYTFKPHPTSIIGVAKKLIFSAEHNYERIANCGIDILIEQRFDQNFSQLSSKAFIALLQKRMPSLKGICVGKDFHFGHARSGDIHSLSSIAKAANLDIHMVPTLYFKAQERISSTRIRQAIQEGDLKLANDMLGESFYEH